MGSEGDDCGETGVDFGSSTLFCSVVGASISTDSVSSEDSLPSDDNESLEQELPELSDDDVTECELSEEEPLDSLDSDPSLPDDSSWNDGQRDGTGVFPLSEELVVDLGTGGDCAAISAS